jgi:opacity protein-like surface antigen
MKPVTLFQTSFTSRGLALAAALFVVLAVPVAGPAEAGPIGWQVSGGWYTDPDDFLVGAGARFGAGSIAVIPNAEYLFVDGGTAYTLNVDATMSVLPLGVASVYAGGGLGWLTFDPDTGDSNTDTVYNLIAGASFNVAIKPFAQIKYLVQDGDDRIGISGGIRF